MWWFGLFAYLCHFPKSERVPSGGKPSWVVVEYCSPKWNCGLGGGRLRWLRRLLLGGSGVSVWMSSPWHRNCSRLSVIAKLAVVGLDLVLHPNNYGGSRFPYKSYKELMWHDWGVAVRDSSRLISFIRALQNSIISYKVALVWACGQVQSLGCMTLLWEPLDQFLLAPGTGTLGSWGQGLSSWEGVVTWAATVVAALLSWQSCSVPTWNPSETAQILWRQSRWHGCQCVTGSMLMGFAGRCKANVLKTYSMMMMMMMTMLIYDDGDNSEWWWWWWSWWWCFFKQWWWFIMMMMTLNGDDGDDNDDDDSWRWWWWWWWFMMMIHDDDDDDDDDYDDADSWWWGFMMMIHNNDDDNSVF